MPMQRTGLFSGKRGRFCSFSIAIIERWDDLMFWSRRKIADHVLLDSVKEFIRSHYEPEPDHPMFSLSPGSMNEVMKNVAADSTTPKQAEQIRKVLEEGTEATFVDKLLGIIGEKGLRDTEVYKSAQVDRRLYSKIVSARTYRPSKDTCIALCLALGLDQDEATDMLFRAGHSLSHSSARDLIFEYFFREGIHDVDRVNEVLYCLGFKTLGRSV